MPDRRGPATYTVASVNIIKSHNRITNKNLSRVREYVLLYNKEYIYIRVLSRIRVLYYRSSYDEKIRMAVFLQNACE